MRKIRKDPARSPQRAKDSTSHSRRPPTKPPTTDHYQELLVLLKSEDIMEVMQGVTQLSSELVMAQDDVLGSFPLDLMTPSLIECLHKEGLDDISLYALNCLNQLADSVPNVCTIIVAAGGIPALCSKLMNLSYIDVSEQAIKLLDKLSYEHAPVILQEGGFSALLNVMDFFETSVQRTVLNILISVARSLPSLELFQQEIVPALPIVSALLQYRSKEAVPTNESALEFFIGLVGSLERLARGAAEQLSSDLDIIHSQGVVTNVMELAQMEKPLLPQVFKLLKALCRGSAVVLLDWLRMGGSEMLAAALTVEETEGEAALGEYVIDALQLMEGAFPSVPEGKHPTNDPRDAVFRANPDMLTNLGQVVIPKLLPLYERFVNKAVKQLTLDILEKVVLHEELLHALSPKRLADFISELMVSREVTIVRKALKITILLFRKIPEQVARSFVKAGVIFRVEQLRDPKNKREWTLSGPTCKETSSKSRLRHLLEGMEGGIESRNLDQFLMFLRRRERSTTDSDPPLPDRLKRYMSDPATDPMELAKAEIDKLSFEVLLFHQRHGKETYGQALNELKAVSNYFFTTTSDTPEPHLSNLLRLIASGDDVSAYEMEVSKVIDALWRWLTSSQEIEEVQSKKLQTVSTRLREFLRILLRDSGSSDSSFLVMTKMLTAMVKCNQQLPVTLYETNSGSNTLAGLRTLSQRIVIQLTFSPQQTEEEFEVEERVELEAKAAIFSQCGPLGITLEQYHSLDTITEVLAKVKSQEDLEIFKSSFYRSASEIRGINQGQLNLIRQHLRLQQMMSENFDLAASLEELGVRLDGNEDLLNELQEQMRHPSAEEEFESDEGLEEVELPRERKISSGGSTSRLKAVLLVNNVEVDKHATVFQVVSKFQDHNPDEPFPLSFRFKRIEDSETEGAKYIRGGQAILWTMLKEATQVGLEASDPLHPPLRMLKLLYAVNKMLPMLFSRTSLLFPHSDETNMQKHPMPVQSFSSPKLSALLTKQTSDVLATVGHTASDWVWRLPTNCPFIFSFAARLHLLKGGNISPTRGLQYFSTRLKQSGEQFQVRLPRQKVRVSRDHVLESAMRVMNDKTLLQFGSLEFDYVDEEGTGAGPTLEFYSLTAREIRTMKIWRTSGEECGLFPCPTKASDSVIEMFEFLGRFVGKALTDEKVIDLPLSGAFWKLIFGQTLTLSDLAQVDKTLHRSLLDLHEVISRRNWILSNPNLTTEMRERQLSQLTYKGTNVSDLSLTFTLPGYDWELRANGKNEVVSLESLEDYIHLVAEATLMQTAQAAAFRKGLEVLLPSMSLSGFSSEELEALVCGEGSASWDLDVLQETVVPAHGYTKSSAVYQNLLLAMTQLSGEEKKTFLQFITGSPRLPIGGFKSLSPPLTVVRKDTNGPADTFLPSVMTCQSYLKLPAYSSFEVLQKNLKYAFTEAHDMFYLT